MLTYFVIFLIASVSITMYHQYKSAKEDREIKLRRIRRQLAEKQAAREKQAQHEKQQEKPQK